MNDFNIGLAIKNIRQRYGLTQRELANDICDQTLISRIEKGVVIPSSLLLMKISERLGVDVNYVINFAKYNNFEYVNEVIHQVEVLLKNKSFQELNTFIKAEKANPYFKSQEGEQYLLWLEGICAYHVNGDSNIAVKLLKEAFSKRGTRKKSQSDLDISIMNSLCVIYGEEKKYPNAIKIYEELYDEIDTHPSLNYKLKSKILYNYSKILINIDSLAASIDVCNKGIKVSRGNDSIYLLGNFYYQLSFIYSLLHKYENSLKYIELAMVMFEIENRDDFMRIAKKKKEELLTQL
ncbi:helix-turn-helix domain-containing protein [Alkalihalophilus lindianensis]|uniref:Helix-turn-helix domain-containing protein n=1 Tax=Alkalihalophilus lindianensis TaxID=1630542 RepID=A0ABU3X819_9BACI|nr:helix-turn-helix domain-containing protein [Alkalihalophilus lindianensis]MDV2684030.1 helix-turn-helix domain-containing protein [Alkalihalophilus lindianensis]